MHARPNAAFYMTIYKYKDEDQLNGMIIKRKTLKDT